MIHYVFRYSKQGDMRYISHLDVQRLFQRMFRRINVEISHTKGYHPKPMMYIALPLSLGFESVCELVQIVTLKHYDIRFLTDAANAALPDGIRILETYEIEPSAKSIPSLVEFAGYDIRIPVGQFGISKLDIESFYLQNSIIVNKIDKRTKRMVEKEARNSIIHMEWVDCSDGILHIRAVLKASGPESLNPMLLAEALCTHVACEFKKEACRIVRTELYCSENESPEPLISYLIHARPHERSFADQV